ncbi:hypothetical protein ACNKXS_14995 [Christiangramia marina]|uniref:hypothetical protein n=1 Tax=Christiangramia marina TaxID=409436 RepID=UPI003AA9167D
MKSRQDYKESIQDLRRDKLKGLIAKEEPEFVIFYSSNKEYYNYWSAISETNFKEIDPIIINEKNNLKVKIAKKQKTFAVIHHPTAFGVRNRYYKEVAKEIKTVANNG